MSCIHSIAANIFPYGLPSIRGGLLKQELQTGSKNLLAFGPLVISNGGVLSNNLENWEISIVGLNPLNDPWHAQDTVLRGLQFSPKAVPLIQFPL